jgi:HTH-type transcriptional regulator, glycine betaine synthesis regulator
MADSLNTVRDDFLLAMGRISDFWGFNKAMGLIYGILYLNSGPLSLDEIAASLNMSKGNVSLNVRSLERWGLIKKVSQKNDRKDYYEAESDFWKMARGIIRERDKKEFDQALVTVSTCLENVRQIKRASATDETQFLEDRFKQMKEFFDTLDSLAKAVLALDKLHLANLTHMKLGGSNKK